MTKTSLLDFLNDARFWIALLFLIRLYHIDLAPLDVHHWRQSITLGVARSYVEEDANFFHPRTLLRDSRTGILAQEFPVYNYLVFIGWKIFGQENWVFRLISIIFSSLGLWWFYLVVKRLVNHRTAMFAMILFGSSIAFIYGRKAMPDVFSISLAIGGVYYGWKYLENQKWSDALWFFILASLGMLSKIPAAAVLTLLAFPFLLKDTSNRARIRMVIMSLGAVGLVFIWYYVWVPWAIDTYGHSLFYPQGISKGWNQIFYEYGHRTFERFESLAMQSKFGFYVCIVGLLTLVFVKKHRLLLLTWFFSSIVFFYFMLESGFVFSTHEYYVIPYIPMMALCGGLGLDYWLPKSKWISPTVLLLFAYLGISAQWKDMSIEEEYRKYLKLEDICNTYIEKDARILTNVLNGNPMMLYQCHRKGWNIQESWKRPEWVMAEASVGLKYLVLNKSGIDTPPDLPMLYEDEDFVIYKTVLEKK